MFSVGEFARLAQVSKRLLRYYDEIGLLSPVHVDRFTGYRTYSAEQLPQLNRILALKELGLSLEQIQRMLNNNISTAELEGMLLLRKAESEQQLQLEAMRLRNIESRLHFLRNADAGETLDVILKQVPAQPVLSMRRTIESFAEGVGYFFGTVVPALANVPGTGLFFAIWRSGGPYEMESDVEIGCMMAVAQHEPLPLPGGAQLEFRTLPAVATMATFVVQGQTQTMHTGYSAIGTWAELNSYRLAAPPRELFLKVPQKADFSDGVTEIQYPVEPV